MIKIFMEFHANNLEPAPLISIILPVYNGEKYLEECIQSVLNQSLQQFEFIIIDDGSTDSSQEILSKHDFIIKIKSPNSGVASARNQGLKIAKGEWICFIDQDDLWTSDSLESRYSHLIRQPKAQLITGKQKWFLDGLDEMPSWVKADQMNKDLDGYLLGCAMIHRALFDKYGDFDQTFRFSSDFDWFFRLKDDHITFHQIDSVILKKRIHLLNESRHASMSLKELSRAIFNSIKRKRNASK